MITPETDCQRCPRLCSFRNKNRIDYPEYFNAPVPSFGSMDAEFLVVGLAPGLKGANQTGRPFTGDYAGLVLYSALKKYDLAKGNYDQRIDDGFELVNCRVTNAVRCVPPENKPEPSEIKNCNNFLTAEIAAMKKLKIILSLGLVSHNAVLKSFKFKPSFAKFEHSATHNLPNNVVLLNTYHTSRYNVNTGRLTQEMFDNIISQVTNYI